MTQEQVKECINYYNAFWPEKSLTDDTTLKLFAVKLLPLDFELAMKAIDDACTASPGFMPSVGQVLAAYQAAGVARARDRGWVPGIGWGGSVPSNSNALASGSSRDRTSEVLSNVRERWERFKEGKTQEELEAHMAMLRSKPVRDLHPRLLFRCLRCKDSGWLADRSNPLAVREVMCGCAR